MWGTVARACHDSAPTRAWRSSRPRPLPARWATTHVDTEHLLLGILEAGPDAVGAAVLARCGIGRDVVEQEVVAVGGSGTSAARGHIPFSPAAKKVLELSLRESLALGHRRIDTAHVLLALLRERKGVAARLLERHGVDRDRVLRIMREGVSATDD